MEWRSCSKTNFRKNSKELSFDKTVEVAEVESDVSDASDDLSALLHPRISKKDGVSALAVEKNLRRAVQYHKHTVLERNANLSQPFVDGGNALPRSWNECGLIYCVGPPTTQLRPRHNWHMLASPATQKSNRAANTTVFVESSSSEAEGIWCLWSNDVAEVCISTIYGRIWKIRLKNWKVASCNDRIPMDLAWPSHFPLIIVARESIAPGWTKRGSIVAVI